MSDIALLTYLEALIDRYGLPAVVNGLASICHRKSNHISHTWHNRRLARAWNENGRKLSFISETLKA